MQGETGNRGNQNERERESPEEEGAADGRKAGKEGVEGVKVVQGVLHAVRGAVLKEGRGAGLGLAPRTRTKGSPTREGEPERKCLIFIQVYVRTVQCSTVVTCSPRLDWV